MDRIVRLANVVRNYAWGSHRVIAELLGERSPSALPEAELWIGAHPSAPSRIVDESGADLAVVIAADPVAALGPEVANRFGSELPFLMKVLAAEAPLSLQAHPDPTQAREGFARENAAGIPLDAPERNYRDPRAKPELLCALTPFDVMIGFRPVTEIVARFRSVGVREIDAELDSLASAGGSSVLPSFFAALYRLGPERRMRTIHQALEGARRRRNEDRAFAWLVELHERYPADIGVLAPLLLNVIRMVPGDAIALRPGELHGYLHGAGVEVMANSDNVLRAGLTAKNVDLPELLRVLRPEQRSPPFCAPIRRAPAETVYETDAEEFALSVVRVDPGTVFEATDSRSAELLLCTDGAGAIRTVRAKPVCSFRRGDAFYAPAAAGAYRVEGEATLYRVGVPPLRRT